MDRSIGIGNCPPAGIGVALTRKLVHAAEDAFQKGCDKAQTYQVLCGAAQSVLADFSDAEVRAFTAELHAGCFVDGIAARCLIDGYVARSTIKSDLEELASLLQRLDKTDATKPLQT